MKGWKWWACMALTNLTLVAVLGVLMRFKIAWSLPWLTHTFTMYGHSGFAFAGWVSLALFILLPFALFKRNKDLYHKLRPYWRWTLLVSFGMLGSFMSLGYHPISIGFNAAYLITGGLYLHQLRRLVLINTVHPITKLAVGYGLWSYMLAAMGPVMLSFLMLTHKAGTQWYLASVYMHLHFNYNGWFFFGMLALFTEFYVRQTNKGHTRIRVAINLLAVSCIPAYFLSVLWMNPPAWLRVLAVGADLVQFAGFTMLAFQLWKHRNVFGVLKNPVRWLWGLSFVALAVKFTLQLLSAIPALEDYAFAFRPVVIAYVHLVLLGVVTFFLLGFFIQNELISIRTPLARVGLFSFIFGVLLNELLLASQGIMAISMVPLFWINPALFAVGLIMLSGLISLLFAQRFVVFNNPMDS
jgi:hypothetical protein